MKPLGPEREHYWLALSMAQTVGVDLSRAIEDGQFDQAQWADTVQRCRGCEWAGECKGWLDEHESVAAAPRTCVNADLFTRLKDVSEEA